MSLRSKLVFRYALSEIQAAAKAKAIYHEKRHAHWEAETANAETEAKKSVQTVSHAVTGGQQITAILDPEKAKWLSTCQAKRDYHYRLMEEFEAWMTCLPRAVGTEGDLLTNVTLDQEDARYFGLIETSDDED